MKTLSSPVHPSFPASKWPQAGGFPTIFFDIETTGFHRSYCHLVLIGIMSLQDGQWKRTQWFAQTPEDEGELLRAFLKALPSPALLISFNGERFDIPFLAARLVHWRIFSDVTTAQIALLKDRIHLDLLTVAKLLPASLPSRRLKAIEAYLGIHRSDTISGGDSVALYRQYQRQQDAQLLDAMLLHNADDIDNMLPLWRLFDYIDSRQLGRKPDLTPRGVLFTYTLDSFLSIEGLLPFQGSYFWQSAGHSCRIEGHRLSLKLSLTRFEDAGTIYTLVPYPELPEAFHALPQSTWLVSLADAPRHSAITAIVDYFISSTFHISEM